MGLLVAQKTLHNNAFVGSGLLVCVKGNVQLGGKKCLVGKKYVSSWKKLFSQLET